MSIQSPEELECTRKKLRQLEAHFEARLGEPAADPELRAVSLRSVKQVINQLKEEIIRYEAGCVPRPRGIQSDRELSITQDKLRQLEEQYQKTQERPSADTFVYRATLRSLKSLINQLTEEIVRYEAHAKVKS